MPNNFTRFNARSESDHTVVARIGPAGIEWRNSSDAPVEDHSCSNEEEPTADGDHALKEALHARRKAVALRAFQTELRRRTGTMNEEDVLAEVARRRGVGSLHHDLGLR